MLMAMNGDFYFYFVTAIAVVYAVSVRIIQNKLMDKNLMKETQEKSRQINELHKEAAKHNDKRKMDEISKMNEELMPRMNAMLFGQMKMMVVVLAVFFAFTWVSAQFDPAPHDDFSITLANDSENYSGSFVLENATPGLWYATVNAYKGNDQISMNQTVFFVGAKKDEVIWTHATGAEMQASVEKDAYSNGETVKIFANPRGATNVTATLNSGTRFYVDLPVTIPLINLRRIYDSQSWFIFSAVIIGLFIAPAVSLMEKYLPKRQNK